MTGQCKESKHDWAVHGVKTSLGSAMSQNMNGQCKDSKHDWVVQGFKT